MAIRYHDKDDKELLQSFYDDGNNECLGILLKRYTGMLLGVSMKYLKNEDEAKDNVQQVFLKVINELQKYKVEYFKSWLYMVAKNHCLMKLRNKKYDTVEVNDTLHSIENEQDDKVNLIVKENSLNNLENALGLLNEEQQVCVTLFYLKKKTYHEIIEITKYNALQVKSNIQNGKRNLKIILQRMAQNEQ
jgi:RNA polymerase sigma factor (sigma-70 family)